MQEFLLNFFQTYGSALTGGLAVAGFVGVIFSRLTWKSGCFWTLTKHVWNTKGWRGLLMSLGLPILADIPGSLLYFKQAIGLKRAKAKCLNLALVSPEAIREPRTLMETYHRILTNPSALQKMSAVKGKEGNLLIVTYKLAKEDAPWAC